jgi:hypothetical protein
MKGSGSGAIQTNYESGCGLRRPKNINNMEWALKSLVSLLSLVDKITNVPVVYMGLDVWIWMGEIHFSGRLKGWALKSRLFWAQMALATFVAISGPKKVSISGPTPSNAPCYGLLPHTNPYFPPHINNKYHTLIVKNLSGS